MKQLFLPGARARITKAFLSTAGAVYLALAAPTSQVVSAAPTHPEIWISPTDDVTQHGLDFHDYFLHPELWPHAAAAVSRFTIPIRYLLETPPDVVAREMAALHKLGIPLSVAIPAMPVDKNVCGHGIEGAVWPGEPASFANKLKARNVDVYSFTLDLPISAGVLDNSSHACHLSVHDAANHTAQAIAAVLAVYPNAKIVEYDVPTGIPVAKWSAILSEWIDAYKTASGRDIDGFIMDAWWLFDWQSAARETVRILAPRHIKVGIGIDASGSKNVPAAQWIATAKQNACAFRAANIPVDFLDVPNWQNMSVRGLPETDPNTLTALVDWLATDYHCGR